MSNSNDYVFSAKVLVVDDDYSEPIEKRDISFEISEWVNLTYFWMVYEEDLWDVEQYIEADLDLSNKKNIFKMLTEDVNYIVKESVANELEGLSEIFTEIDKLAEKVESLGLDPDYFLQQFEESTRYLDINAYLVVLQNVFNAYRSPATFRMKREYVGVPQADLAEKLHVNVDTVKKWEKGTATIPNDAWDALEEWERFIKETAENDVRYFGEYPYVLYFRTQEQLNEYCAKCILPYWLVNSAIREVVTRYQIEYPEPPILVAYPDEINSSEWRDHYYGGRYDGPLWKTTFGYDKPANSAEES